MKEFQPEKTEKRVFGNEGEAKVAKLPIEDLISGNISPEDFQRVWQEQDQSGSHTEYADSHIQQLEDPRLRTWVGEHPEYAESYHRMLATSYFHRGQREFNLSDFRRAVEEAEQGKNEHFAHYARGTLAFLEGDRNALEKSYRALDPESINARILERFLRVLDLGGNPVEMYYRAYTES